MASKDKLANMLRRGQGVQLSIADTQQRVSAQSQSSAKTKPQKRTIASSRESEEPQRINRGYMLREDLVKQLKHLAIEKDRNLYELMEEAIEAYLKRQG